MAGRLDLGFDDRGFGCAGACPTATATAAATAVTRCRPVFEERTGTTTGFQNTYNLKYMALKECRCGDVTNPQCPADNQGSMVTTGNRTTVSNICEAAANVPVDHPRVVDFCRRSTGLANVTAAISVKLASCSVFPCLVDGKNFSCFRVLHTICCPAPVRDIKDGECPPENVDFKATEFTMLQDSRQVLAPGGGRVAAAGDLPPLILVGAPFGDRVLLSVELGLKTTVDALTAERLAQVIGGRGSKVTVTPSLWGQESFVPDKTRRAEAVQQKRDESLVIDAQAASVRSDFYVVKTPDAQQAVQQDFGKITVSTLGQASSAGNPDSITRSRSGEAVVTSGAPASLRVNLYVSNDTKLDDTDQLVIGGFAEISLPCRTNASALVRFPSDAYLATYPSGKPTQTCATMDGYLFALDADGSVFAGPIAVSLASPACASAPVGECVDPDSASGLLASVRTSNSATGSVADPKLGVYRTTIADRCQTDTILLEQTCNASGFIVAVPFDCRETKGFCDSRRCRSCFDSDSTAKFPLLETGYVRTADSKEADYCSDSDTLVEFSCNADDNPTATKVSCSSLAPNLICQQGRCVAPAGDMCVDSDGGLLSSLAGVASLGSVALEDRCDPANSKVVLEAVCGEKGPMYVTVSCPTRPVSVCSEGRCTVLTKRRDSSEVAWAEAFPTGLCGCGSRFPPDAAGSYFSLNNGATILSEAQLEGLTRAELGV
jgi:hypothetical protein